MPPVPLSLAQITQPGTALDWNTALLSMQNTLGLPTTAWPPGSVERTIDASVANVMQQSDIQRAIMVQAGFLTFAASGFVTYVAADGTTTTVYVTPDPSIPSQNPTGALGWLDVLADGVYDEQRILTSPAGGALVIVNQSVTTYGPFASTGGVGGGTYHVAQAAGPTYSNTASLTIPPTPQITGGGTISLIDSSGGLIRVTVNTAPPTGTLVAIVGVNGVPALVGTTAWTITHTSATQFTLDGSAFSGSPSITAASLVYLPQTASFTADVSGTGSNAAANTVTQTVTSLSGVSITNPSAWTGSDTESNVALANRCRLKLAALAVGQPGGAYVYYALLAQVLAPKLSPPQTVSETITRALVSLDITTDTLYVTIANKDGGSSAQDVAVVQAVIDAYVGVTTTTDIVQAADDVDVTVVLTVYLPAQFNTTGNQSLFALAVAAYFQTLPIGGVSDPGDGTPNVVPYNAVLGSVWQAAKGASIPLQQVTGTLNSGTANIPLALSPVPQDAVASITVNLVSV